MRSFLVLLLSYLSLFLYASAEDSSKLYPDDDRYEFLNDETDGEKFYKNDDRIVNELYPEENGENKLLFKSYEPEFKKEIYLNLPDTNCVNNNFYYDKPQKIAVNEKFNTIKNSNSVGFKNNYEGSNNLNKNIERDIKNNLQIFKNTLHNFNNNDVNGYDKREKVISVPSHKKFPFYNKFYNNLNVDPHYFHKNYDNGGETLLKNNYDHIIKKSYFPDDEKYSNALDQVIRKNNVNISDDILLENINKHYLENQSLDKNLDDIKRNLYETNKNIENHDKNVNVLDILSDTNNENKNKSFDEMVQLKRNKNYLKNLMRSDIFKKSLPFENHSTFIKQAAVTNKGIQYDPNLQKNSLFNNNRNKTNNTNNFVVFFVVNKENNRTENKKLVKNVLMSDNRTIYNVSNRSNLQRNLSFTINYSANKSMTYPPTVYIIPLSSDIHGNSKTTLRNPLDNSYSTGKFYSDGIINYTSDILNLNKKPDNQNYIKLEKSSNMIRTLCWKITKNFPVKELNKETYPASKYSSAVTPQTQNFNDIVTESEVKFIKAINSFIASVLYDANKLSNMRQLGLCQKYVKYPYVIDRSEDLKIVDELLNSIGDIMKKSIFGQLCSNMPHDLKHFLDWLLLDGKSARDEYEEYMLKRSGCQRKMLFAGSICNNETVVNKSDKLLLTPLKSNINVDNNEFAIDVPIFIKNLRESFNFPMESIHNESFDRIIDKNPYLLNKYYLGLPNENFHSIESDKKLLDRQERSLNLSIYISENGTVHEIYNFCDDDDDDVIYGIDYRNPITISLMILSWIAFTFFLLFSLYLCYLLVLYLFAYLHFLCL